MDLNQIRYFIHLADLLNFTEAARRSGVSQPSLTKAIMRLEEELGGQLIYRDGKDNRLTALGREMQVEFMKIDSLINNIHELAEDSLGGRKCKLRVGVMTTIAPAPFAKFWSNVLTELPHMELHFSPMLPDEDEYEVLAGNYDLCILSQLPKPNFKLTSVPLYSEPLQLAVALNHELAKQEEILPDLIAEHPYVDRLHCEFRTRVINYFMNRNIVMKPNILSEREDWVQQFVADGLGVTTLPKYSLIVKGLTLRPVTGLELSREVTLVAVSGSGNPVELRKILSIAENYDWEALLSSGAIHSPTC